MMMPVPSEAASMPPAELRTRPSGTTSKTYAQQTFTFTGALTGNATIYGYYLVGSIDGVIRWAELLAAPFTPASNGDAVNVTPRLELA